MTDNLQTRRKYTYTVHMDGIINEIHYKTKEESARCPFARSADNDSNNVNYCHWDTSLLSSSITTYENHPTTTRKSLRIETPNRVMSQAPNLTRFNKGKNDKIKKSVTGSQLKTTPNGACQNRNIVAAVTMLFQQRIPLAPCDNFS